MRPQNGFFSEKAGAIGAMGKKKVKGTRAHADSHNHRHEANETEREREREREREGESENESEREREREKRTPHSGAFQNMKRTLRKNSFRE